MGEEEADTDFTVAPLSWILKSKLAVGVIVGIFLGPALNRTTEGLLNRVFPRDRSGNAPFGAMADQYPEMYLMTQRLEVLNQLVRDRHILDGGSGCPVTVKVVQALNRVPLVFAGEGDVISSYNVLTQESGRSPVAFGNMLSAMAEALEIEEPVLGQKGILYQCK